MLTDPPSLAPDGTAYSLAGDGPATVVLVHGLGLSRAMWQWQHTALAQRYRVLTYDLYGHGEVRRRRLRRRSSCSRLSLRACSIISASNAPPWPAFRSAE